MSETPASPEAGKKPRAPPSEAQLRARADFGARMKAAWADKHRGTGADPIPAKATPPPAPPTPPPSSPNPAAGASPSAPAVPGPAKVSFGGYFANALFPGLFGGKEKKP